MPKFVIATFKVPTDVGFFDLMKACAAEGGNVIKGYSVVPGPGCANHGILIEGPDVEGFMRHLTNFMMGKWASVPDDDPAVVDGLFYIDPEFNKESDI